MVAKERDRERERERERGDCEIQRQRLQIDIEMVTKRDRNSYRDRKGYKERQKWLQRQKGLQRETERVTKRQKGLQRETEMVTKRDRNGYKERQKGSIIKSIVIIKSSLFIVHLKSSHSKSGISRDEVSPPPRVVIEVSTFLIINQVHHGSEINTQEIGNQSLVFCFLCWY